MRKGLTDTRVLPEPGGGGGEGTGEEWGLRETEAAPGLAVRQLPQRGAGLSCWA